MRRAKKSQKVFDKEKKGSRKVSIFSLFFFVLPTLALKIRKSPLVSSLSPLEFILNVRIQKENFSTWIQPKKASSFTRELFSSLEIFLLCWWMNGESWREIIECEKRKIKCGKLFLCKQSTNWLLPSSSPLCLAVFRSFGNE